MPEWLCSELYGSDVGSGGVDQADLQRLLLRASINPPFPQLRDFSFGLTVRPEVDITAVDDRDAPCPATIKVRPRMASSWIASGPRVVVLRMVMPGATTARCGHHNDVLTRRALRPTGHLTTII